MPRNLNDSTAVSAVHDGGWGGRPGGVPEVHDHLHCFERIQLQVVNTAPNSQLLNLLSVSRKYCNSFIKSLNFSVWLAIKGMCRRKRLFLEVNCCLNDRPFTCMYGV